MKEILPLVSKPVRYLGGEIHSVRKDPAAVKLRFCLAFPDVYEVGMSHLGVQILYTILNGMESVSCERAFAPWNDMEKLLRDKQIPLCSLETSTPLREFDILGFSLQYELSFTNLLNMLDLGGVPLRSAERDDTCPLVIAGGPLAFNPAPIADFFDAIVVGDGEEAVVQISKVVLEGKASGGRRDGLLRALSAVEGVYVPSFHKNGTTIRRRIVRDLDETPFPTCPIIPFMKVIHDRLSIEIARGCKRGCRFCEAGFIHRPYRERNPELIEKTIQEALRKTGYEEVSLLSLSAGDYSSIAPLLGSLMDRLEEKKIAVSFPSLRIESVMGQLAEQVKRVRKTGFTLAPEAGTDRLRRVINKELDEDVLFQGLEHLFSEGWRSIKLYFMIGLPTERDEDLRGIVDLGKKMVRLGEKKKVHPNVTISVSTFVPKPHTPFQWAAQIPFEEMKEKLDFLREALRRCRIQFKWQDPHLSFLEGVFSMGDRKLSPVLLQAYQMGCRFDGWTEQFRESLWREAFERTGVDPRAYTGEKKKDEAFPWAFIETGVSTAYLREEYERALREEMTPACTEEGCRRCNLCNGENLRVRHAPPLTPFRDVREEKGRIRRKAGRRKIRILFTKTGDARFLSHLELSYLFHRASKRAQIPLRYSEGFHPLPRIVFGDALPVGVESLAERADMEVEGPILPSELMERLNRTLPEGVRIVEAREVPALSPAPPMATRTVYRIRPGGEPFCSREEVERKVEGLLRQEAFLLSQERKGKERQVDLRSFIERMEVVKEGEGLESGSGWVIDLVLRRIGGRTVKPTEVLREGLGFEEEALAQCRIVKVLDRGETDCVPGPRGFRKGSDYDKRTDH